MTSRKAITEVVNPGTQCYIAGLHLGETLCGKPLHGKPRFTNSRRRVGCPDCRALLDAQEGEEAEESVGSVEVAETTADGLNTP